MTPLWTERSAARATGGKAIGSWQVTGLSIDTRELEKGDLFVALKDQRDGHDFVAEALANGAGAAIVSTIPEGVAQNAPLLVVDDVLEALGDLARAARVRFRGKVVAVTGSVGKTSTKEMLRTVLERQGKTHAAVRSFNNHWGVPLTLARMPADADFALIEIGMNAPGEIAPLSKMAAPDAAMITTIAPAHLEAFDDLAAIAHEKASICEGLSEPNGIQVVPADVPDEARRALDQGLNATLRRCWFGSAAENPWHLIEVRVLDDCTIIKAVLPDLGEVLFKLSVPGRHFALNALGVLAVVQALGADPVLAAHDLANWRPPEGRGGREIVLLDPFEQKSFALFDDAFNANPASMAAAFEVLAAVTGGGNGRMAAGRKIAILGDMLELGPNELQMHAALAEDPSLREIDLVHTVGPRMKYLARALPEINRGQHFENAQGAAAQAHSLVAPEDTVLVKGSKGSKVSIVVDALKKLGHSQRERKTG